MAVAGVVSAPAFAEVSGFGSMGIKMTDSAGVSDTQVVGIFGLNASGEAQTNGGSTVYGNLSLTYSNGEVYGTTGADFTTTGAVVGIKGDFGNIHLGDGGSGIHLAQLAGDRMDVSVGGRTRNSIGYTNSFGDITFRVTSDPSESNGVTASGGIPVSLDAEGTTSVGIQGTFSGVTVGFGQEEDDSTVGAAMSFGDIGLAIHSTSWDLVDDSSVAVKLSYSAGDVSASFQTESFSDIDYDRSQIDVAYSLGGGASVKFRSRMDDDEANEYTRIMLGLNF
ncbi:MAG: porin [Gammaproteobacteria bacterium]|nr:porin [Gammaproteobacteria bacterium]